MSKEEWFFLTDAFNEVEADIICGVLETNEIPFKKEYPTFTGIKVIFGQATDVTIMVPRQYLERAKELLKEIVEEEEEE